MTLCPIAIAVSCKKCPALRVCLLKSVIGDYNKDETEPKPKAGEAKRDAKKPK